MTMISDPTCFFQFDGLVCRIRDGLPYAFTTVEVIPAAIITSTLAVRLIMYIAAGAWHRGGHGMYLMASKRPNGADATVSAITEEHLTTETTLMRGDQPYSWLAGKGDRVNARKEWVVRAWQYRIERGG
ncbi:hypothetical protein BU17DRAFT_60327 [Hysterangium stoloniferum]|nr:hypothetical protein BU17DRAFT_60327 [Hysterangium stoloniferum]